MLIPSCLYFGLKLKMAFKNLLLQCLPKLKNIIKTLEIYYIVNKKEKTFFNLRQ